MTWSSCKYEGSESGRCPLFVETFNYALGELSRAKVPGLRSASELGILFHRSDPIKITGEHGTGCSSSRVPVINIVSQAAARRTSGRPEDDLNPSKKPRNQFSWLDVFATLEFKKDKKNLPNPPHEYNPSPLQPIPPKRFGGDSELTLDYAPPTTNLPHSVPAIVSQNSILQPEPITGR